MTTHPLLKLVPRYTSITLPNNSSTNIIINNLNKLRIKTASLPSKKIRDLVHSSHQSITVSDIGIYCIPCKNCKLKYIDKTTRNLHVRLKGHKRDIRIGNINNALLQHISIHNFDFNSEKMLIYNHNKRLGRIFEASPISLCKSINTRLGFYNFSPYWNKLNFK